MTRRTVSLLVVTALAAIVSPSRAGQVWVIEVLDTTPDARFSGTAYTQVHAVSADGSYLTSWGFVDTTAAAFRWGPDVDDVQVLTHPQRFHGPRPTGISADGTRVVGFEAGAGGRDAVQWVGDEPAVELEAPDPSLARAWDVSADGSIIVGSHHLFGEDSFRPVRWSSRTLGLLPAGPGGHGEAIGISPDGSAIVGFVSPGFGFGTPCVWVDGTLNLLPAPDGYHAIDASDGGAVVVGRSIPNAGAARWIGGVFELLIELDDVVGVSADGSIIAGADARRAAAAVWTEELGAVPLPPLVTGGATEVGAISDDGRVVGGRAADAEGRMRIVRWRLVEDAPPGDVTGDGRVDLADLLSILSGWGPCDGCPQDLDGDDAVGIDDLLVVLADWD